MEIHIGYDFIKNEFIKNKEIPQNEFEYKMLNTIIKELNLNNAVINNNTTDYTTLNYKGIDIVRIKYTDRSKWISIYLTDDDKKEYYDSSLFEIQKNKNQFQWKSKINNDNIEQYYKFIKNRCNFIDNKK